MSLLAAVDAQTLVDAVGLGAVYALMAVGIGLVFGVLRLVNFAYGQLVMAGAFGDGSAMAQVIGPLSRQRQVIAIDRDPDAIGAGSLAIHNALRMRIKVVSRLKVRAD
mgnify:CR=1 FL=1